MKHDPLYREIVNRLEASLDPDIFEAFAVAMIHADGFAVVPVVGGNDGGMDGAIANTEGDPFPLICTTQESVIQNLTKSLERYIETGGKQRRCIIVTSQLLGGQKRRNLTQRAEDYDFTLLQLYDQAACAAFLYRTPNWRKELLQITDSLRALSLLPVKGRHSITDTPFGRDEEINWILNTSGDRMLVGEPGSGKTVLLEELTKRSEKRSFFVIDKDLSRIADAVRSLEPQNLIVDDAHIDPDFLQSLRHLRSEIGAEFTIVASCWVGEQSTVADVLNVPQSNILKIQRLSRDQIAHIITTAIKSPVGIWVVKEIVDQAEGLPGLAITLTLSFLQGDVDRVQSAAALTEAVMDTFYVKYVDKSAKDLLASFSLGGKAGMSKDTVAEVLRISHPDLRSTLSALAAGGIISEVQYYPDLIQVRPAALRHALIREVFFSKSSSLPRSILMAFISKSTNFSQTVSELVSVKARGGDVSDLLLQNLLKSDAISTAWRDYAYLGYNQAVWVCEHYAGSVATIAHPVLRNAPKAIIPKLLQAAVSDDRMLNAYPDHPLRLLKDWIKVAAPRTGYAIRRRQVVFEGVKNWLLDGGNIETGYKAILFAVEPQFEFSFDDPGNGTKMNIRFGYLTVDEIRSLNDIWKQIIALSNTIEVTNWSLFLDTVRDWLYIRREASDEVRETIHKQALGMAKDIVERASMHLGIMHDLRQVIQHHNVDFEIPTEPLIEILYPQERLASDWREEQSDWQKSVELLAEEWSHEDTLKCVERIKFVEQAMGNSSFHYPRLTPSLSWKLAEKVGNPLPWVEAMISENLSIDLWSPFLSVAARSNYPGWVAIADQQLQASNNFYYIMETVLRLENPPADLYQQVLSLLPDRADAITNLYIHDRFPDHVVIDLYYHDNPLIPYTAAIAEWQREPMRSVREELRPQWEAAILDHLPTTDDYWLGDIFEVETLLGFKWLRQHIISQDFQEFIFDKVLTATITRLSIQQRLELLQLVPEDYGYYQTIAQIVGNNSRIFRYLLQNERLSNYHLTPLYHSSLNASWKEKVIIAIEFGYSPQEIVARTVHPIGFSVTWSGDKSLIWEDWKRQFQALLESDDMILSEVAEVGIAVAEEAYQKALDRERHEQVYGWWDRG